MQIILKTSRVHAQPVFSCEPKKPAAKQTGGYYPLGFTQNLRKDVFFKTKLLGVPSCDRTGLAV